MMILRVFFLSVVFVESLHGFSDLKAGLEQSKILSEDSAYIEEVAGWVRLIYPYSKSSSKWKLCYSATGETMSGRMFHNRCDGKAKTLSILKNDYKGKEFIYGGFEDMTLNRNAPTYTGTHQDRAFLYTLAPLKSKLRIKEGKSKYAFFTRRFFTLMCFGLAHQDLCCYAHGCESKTGLTYEEPQIESEYLGGYHHKYKPTRVEVFFLEN